MRVINLYGGPGSGKSTTAAGLFYELKRRHVSVELVTEYAKDLLYSGHLTNLQDQQEYIFAEQNFRLHRLRNKVDWVITDSPIMLSTIYASSSYPARAQFCELVRATHDTYSNVNIVLQRPEVYQHAGRVQTLEQSQQLDIQIEEMLQANNFSYDIFQTKQEVVTDIIAEFFPFWPD